MERIPTRVWVDSVLRWISPRELAAVYARTHRAARAQVLDAFRFVDAWHTDVDGWPAPPFGRALKRLRQLRVVWHTKTEQRVALHAIMTGAAAARLESLALEGVPLAYMSAWSPSPRLVELRLWEVPWNADAQLEWLRTWFAAHGPQLHVLMASTRNLVDRSGRLHLPCRALRKLSLSSNDNSLRTLAALKRAGAFTAELEDIWLRCGRIGGIGYALAADDAFNWASLGDAAKSLLAECPRLRRVQLDGEGTFTWQPEHAAVIEHAGGTSVRDDWLEWLPTLHSLVLWESGRARGLSRIVRQNLPRIAPTDLCVSVSFLHDVSASVLRDALATVRRLHLQPSQVHVDWSLEDVVAALPHLETLLLELQVLATVPPSIPRRSKALTRICILFGPDTDEDADALIVARKWSAADPAGVHLHPLASRECAAGRECACLQSVLCVR